MSRIAWRLCIIALFALGVGLWVRGACLRWWPLLFADSGAALPGLRVGGVALARGTPIRSQLEARAHALQERSVRLVVHDGGTARVVAESSLGALGVSVDVDAMLSCALRLGRTGDMVTRARLADRARAGVLDVPLESRIDLRVAYEHMLPLKEDLDVPPIAARLDIERHSGVPERDGRALDLDGAIAAIARAATDPAATDVELPFAVVPPHVTAAALAKTDVSHVLASFATYFSRRGDQAQRAQNIEVAAAHLDGLVIEPGELVSFNDVVGARSGDNGFQKAFEIFKGEMVEGTGGGTCQVASTLHAIAFFGGLDIVERLPHSRPSAYLPVGLDATVVYPVVDLKLRNPYPFPVVVHTTVGANEVAMQLLGADKPVRVALVRTVLSRTPFERKVVSDPTSVKPKRKQKGIDGIKLLRKRLVVPRVGSSRVETSRDNYPPTTEIWRVPPGFDEADLPPLGEDLSNQDSPDSPAPPPAHVSDPEQTIWGR